jgi:hypothetical protein
MRTVIHYIIQYKNKSELLKAHQLLENIVDSKLKLNMRKYFYNYNCLRSTKYERLAYFDDFKSVIEIISSMPGHDYEIIKLKTNKKLYTQLI